ncbi:hypothetical protein BJY52DRAFT_58510 [Lactarius psammicola]|nr:hypothetical protein BJY52DRAFT_58510 [Lactarius psammicola]
MLSQEKQRVATMPLILVLFCWGDSGEERRHGALCTLECTLFVVNLVMSIVKFTRATTREDLITHTPASRASGRAESEGQSAGTTWGHYPIKTGKENPIDYNKYFSSRLRWAPLTRSPFTVNHIRPGSGRTKASVNKIAHVTKSRLSQAADQCPISLTIISLSLFLSGFTATATSPI